MISRLLFFLSREHAGKYSRGGTAPRCPEGGRQWESPSGPERQSCLRGLNVSPLCSASPGPGALRLGSAGGSEGPFPGTLPGVGSADTRPVPEALPPRPEVWTEKHTDQKVEEGAHSD